jgi:HEAT repeat protein
MAQNTNSTIKNLIVALSSHNDFSRVEARKALEAMGRQVVPFLVEALSEIRDPKAVPALVMALEDEEFDIRWLAAKGLIEMNVKGLKPLFQALIEHADSVLLREGAHHVLHDLAKGELRKYLAPMLIALEDMDSTVQVPIAASHALAALAKAKIL